jgi:hypothetical protein
MWWIILGGVVAILIIIGKSSAIKTAKQQYDSALAALRAKPNDPNLRQAALNSGRNYANLTRDQKGVTVFDEVALMNDINAACAAAGAAPQVVATASNSIEERLKTVEGLRDRGVLSEDEFIAKRAEILKSL